eukprot:gene15506-6767_t
MECLTSINRCFLNLSINSLKGIDPDSYLHCGLTSCGTIVRIRHSRPIGPQCEKQLISEKFFCNGRWFTKSCKKGCEWETLAFSFTLSIYGESLVTASVDVQKQAAIRCLSRSDLSDAMSGDTVHVVLAPGGLNAVLTGCSLPSTDGRAARILTEWDKYYPIVKDEKSNGFIPCLVEIVHCDNKMLYPSCLVGLPVSRSGTKFPEIMRSDVNANEAKAGTCSRKAFRPIIALNNRIWDNLEPRKESKKLNSASKSEAAPVFGPNMPLWDFKDKSRTTVCGCTSSTNVNRVKPMGKFGSTVSGLKSTSGHVGISSPSTAASGANQTSSVTHKGRKERKKTSLPFHQRRSTNTERSPTPPITLSANLKAVNVNTGPVLPSNVDLKTEAHLQTGLPSRKSPVLQKSSTSRSFSSTGLDQSYSSVQLQNISPTKVLSANSRALESKGKFKSKSVPIKGLVNYILPSNVMPIKPALSKDTLEARSSLTDPSYSSLCVSKEAENNYSISEVMSPTPLQLSNTKPGGHVPDGEVMIVRMPNKGVKRTTENANNVDESTKKVKLASYAQPQQQQPQQPQQPQHQQQSYAAASPPQSPSPSHFHSQTDSLSYQQTSNASSSAHQQLQTRRGPGRPKKQSTSQSSIYSPKNDQNILENGSILSPPVADKRRRPSSQSTKIKDEAIVSPPSVSSIKAAPVKGSRRRPSKKDQSLSDNELPPVTSPSARSGTVALSPSPYLPSPARTPGSSSGISFTQSKDLVVEFSDRDKLFEFSDDEDDQDNKSRQSHINTAIDAHPNHRPPAHDDVFRSTSLPPPTTSLPHDLSEMFPTPPSQEAQPPAASPATSLPGDYGMPSSYTHCHVVMSPEKHVLPYDKRFEENVCSEGTEGLETPFVVPETQEYPVDGTFTPISVLPSMKRKNLKIKNRVALKYTPSWKTGARTAASYQDKAANLIRLSISNYDSLRRMRAKDIMPCLSQAVIVNTNETIANKKMPEIKTEIIENENIDLKPLISVDVVSQGIVKKEVTVYNGSNIEETRALEVALASKVSVCYSKEESKAWPHNRLFKSDKNLPFISMEDEAELIAKEPKRPEVLDLTGSKDSSGDSSVGDKAASSVLPPRIAELFKEQWLSPFSVLYMTRMLSQVYKVDFHSSTGGDMNAIMASGLLYELNSTVQNAFKQSLKRRTHELQKLEGPVTFSSLNKLSGKNTVQSSLPVHPVLIGADGDYVSVAPNCLKSWTKLLLEPFSGQRDVAYVVVAPDTDLVLENTKQFFRELSITYESMNLGKHGPIIRVLREGIIRVQLKVMQKLANEAVDEWFSQDESAESIRMKLIAQVCKALLGPHLASLELNRTLFDKSPAEEKNSAESTRPKIPGANANSISGLHGLSSLGLIHEETDNGSSNSELPAIVVYMIDPFQVTGVSSSKEPLWSLNGLIRAFAEMTSSFSDALKNNVFLQVVPLESILQLKASTKYHNGTGLNQLDLQHLALSVYSSCRVTINSLNSGKICTGFGPGSLRDKLTKKRQVDQQFPTRVFVPPFILAPQTSLIREDPHTSMDLARVMTTGDGNILFCSYCLSQDLSWVLVTCTDKSGEIADTTIIKVHPQIRQMRESKSTRKMALRRVLNFALDVISFFFETWRIVIHRLGSPGKGELKDLYDLSRKLVTPVQTKKRPVTPEVCVGCRATADEKPRPTVRSITVASVHLDSNVRILPGSTRRKSNSGSKIFVVPVVSQSAKRRDRRLLGSGSLSLPMPPADELIADSVFEEQFMGLLSSPAEVSSSSLLTSLHSDLGQPVFSPGDTMNVSSISTMSPFQPIIQNSPAFSTAFSPVPVMTQPSSTPIVKTGSSDEFTKLCRQPLCSGYILVDSSSLGSHITNTPLIKSDLLFHLTKHDVQLSKHPLDSENHLELHRFVLEQLDALSWLTIDTVTGKRHSALASHIFLLTRFYETFSYFVS